MENVFILAFELQYSRVLRAGERLRQSYPGPPSSNSASHLIDTRALHLMISRLCRCLVDDVRRRLAKPRPLSFESYIADPRHVLFTVSKVILKEERQSLHLAEQRTLHGDLLYIRRLREFQSLCWFGVLGRREIEVGLVDVQVEGLWGGLGG